MLPTIVILAEILVFVWFALFLWLVTETYLDGIDYKATRKSLVELVFFSNVRSFVALGTSVVILLTLGEVSGLINIS